MLKVEAWMDIKFLSQQGHSIRAIARLTGYSRNTIRRVLRQKAPERFHVPKRRSKLDVFKTYVEKRYQQCALSCVRLLEEIRPMGYTGSIATLRRFVQTLKPRREALKKLTVRFETAPGEQAQADWAYCGRFTDPGGRLFSVYLFVMVLSFSRMLYVRFTCSMDLKTLIDCHVKAFQFFGGWPRSVLYDNMKQVRVEPGKFHPLFLDFANHYGLSIKTHAVRRPRTKGKVERMVDYVKDNFLNGRSFIDVEDVNGQGLHWLEHTANVRQHATTGARPIDLLNKEALTACNAVAPYQLSLKQARTVTSEGYVRLDRSRYSVPPENVGRTVIVEQGEQRVRIRLGDLIIAEHPRATKAGSFMAKPEHIEALWKLSLNRPPPQRTPHFALTFDEQVARADLSRYEEVAL